MREPEFYTVQRSGVRFDNNGIPIKNADAVKMSPLLGICPHKYRQMWRHYIGFASRCVGCLCKCVGNRLSGSGNILSLLGKEKSAEPAKTRLCAGVICCLVLGAGLDVQQLHNSRIIALVLFKLLA